MRQRHWYAAGLSLALMVGSLPGCDSAQSSTEVHRTAEFQKAAMNSRDAMLNHEKTQKKPTTNRRGK